MYLIVYMLYTIVLWNLLDSTQGTLEAHFSGKHSLQFIQSTTTIASKESSVVLTVFCYETKT